MKTATSRLIHVLICSLLLTIPIVGRAVSSKSLRAAALPTKPASADVLLAPKSERRKEAREKLNQQMAELAKQIGSLPSGDEKYSRMFSLAELQWKKSHYAGVKYRQKATKLYLYLLKRTPKAAYNETSLFRVAAAEAAAGRVKESQQYFARLQKEYPQSNLLPHATLILADAQYPSNESKSLYQRSLSANLSDTHGYAAYRLGWWFAHDKQYGPALAQFKVASEWGGALLAGNKEVREQVKHAALTSAMRIYLIGGLKPEEDAGFIEQEKPYYRALLESALDTSRANKKRSLAIYSKLIPRAESRKESLAWETDVLRLRIQLNETGTIPKAMENVAALTRPKGGLLGGDDKELVEIKAERTAAEVLMRQHVLAGAASSDFATLARADEEIRHYLDGFPDSSHAASLALVKARTQRKLADHPKAPSADYRREKVGAALETYQRLIEENRPGTDLSATIAMMVATAEALVKIDKPATPAAGSTATMALPASQEKLLTALDTGAAKHPLEGPRRAYAFRGAALVFSYNQYEEADKRFGAIVSKHAASTEAQRSIPSLISLIEKNSKPEAANARARELKKNVWVKGSASSQARLNKVIVATSIELIGQTEKKGNDAAAASAYLALYKEYPTASEAPLLLLRASGAFERSGDLSQAVDLRESFVSRYPKHDDTARSLIWLSNQYARYARYPEAAQALERAAQAFPKNKDATESIFAAGNYRYAMNQLSLAEQDYTAFVQNSPQDDRVVAARFRIAESLHKRGNRTAAIAAFNDFVKRYRTADPNLTIQAQLHIAELTAELGNKQRAYTLYGSVTSTYRELGGPSLALHGRDAAGEAALKALEPESAALKTIKVTSSGRLATKLTKLSTLETLHNEVVDYNSPRWTIAAYYAFGRLCEDTARELTSTPAVGSTPDQRAEFRDKLQTEAGPIMERAVSYYKKAVTLSHQSRLYPEETKLAIARWAGLIPGGSATDPERVKKTLVTSDSEWIGPIAVF